MKHLIKLAFLLLALLLPATTTAHDFEVNGIYYNILNNNEVAVTYQGIDPGDYFEYSGSVTIPSSVIYNGTAYSVTSIGESAFNWSSGLTSVTIPNSVTSIGGHAFSDCSGLTNITIGNSVTTIGESAFFLCCSLTTIDFPNSVTTIGDGAFTCCGSLTSIVIPKSVTSIGNYAFGACSGLTSINVASGNSVYDSRNNCNAIIETASNTLIAGCKNTIIPNSLATIGDLAFFGCSGLTSVDIPNSVTAIGSGAFCDCSNLVSINIPDSVSSIGVDTFYSCSSLENVNIGNSVTTIGESAFFLCCSLTTIDLPNSVTSIGDYTFYNCSSLTCIAIPNSVTSIGERAFFGCSGLTSMTVASGNIAYDSRNSCNAIIETATNTLIVGCKNTMIPNSVTSISNDAFCDCWNLSSIVIPNSVTTIGDEAFHGCGLTSIVIPNSVTTIGDGAFSYSGLDEVYSYITDLSSISMGSSVFSLLYPENYSGRTLYVPAGTSAAYQTDIKWSQYFGHIVEMEEPIYDNYLSIPDAEAFHGDTIVVPVKMFNEASVISFQTDIFLPEGLELLQEDGEYIIDPSERMTRTHSIMSDNVSNGSIRVLCYSSNYKPFTGNSGDDLFYLTLKVADDAEGDYTIQLKNTLLTNTDFVDMPAPDVAATVNVKAYILGDANNSRLVTVGDVVATAQYVLEQNPQPFNFEAADVNFDGNITVADVSRIAWMVLNPDAKAPRRAPALLNSGDCMSGEGISLMRGETRRVSIALDNAMEYNAFQLDLSLPEGLTASNFQLTDRAGSHAFDVNTLGGGNIRALCYSPALTAISGHEGALLTFDVTANSAVTGAITVDGIELVTTACESVRLDGFAIDVNSASGVNEQVAGKTVARVDYYNLAGQQIDRPEAGVTLVVTTYTDGTRATAKIVR